MLLVALLVLGPDKLPEASKKIGAIMGELRKMSSGFKSEMKQALDTPTDVAVKGKEASSEAGPSAATSFKKAIDAASDAAGPVETDARSAGSGAGGAATTPNPGGDTSDASASDE